MSCTLMSDHASSVLLVSRTKRLYAVTAHTATTATIARRIYDVFIPDSIAQNNFATRYGAFTLTVVLPETVPPPVVVQRIAKAVDVASAGVVALPSPILSPIRVPSNADTVHFVVPTLDHAMVAFPFMATVLGFAMMVTTGVSVEGFCVGGICTGDDGGCTGAGAGFCGT